MLNLIKADLFKVFNRAYMYIFLGIMVFIVIGVNLLVLIAATTPLTVFDIMSLGLKMLIFPIFFVLMFVDITANEEMKDSIIKNAIDFGIPRNKLYLSKIITSVILAFISAIVVLTAFLGSAFLLLSPGEAFTAAFAAEFTLKILCALPLYIGAITIGVLFSFVIKKSTLFAFAYVGLFTIIGSIIKMLIYLISDKFLWVYNALITTNLTILSGDNVTSVQMFTAAGIGFVYTIIFTVIGVMVFKRQEIK